uniref:Uncharacterized protein n=2 Tax=unclassified bacterial viruses TaxID=12333 RepID=A0AAU6VYQ9_9VIRU
MAVILDRLLNGGTQVVHKFDNGYGASVIRSGQIAGFGTSYGYEDGLFELAVLEFPYGDEQYSLTYSTPITDDVLGHLTEEDVIAVLAQIEALEV